jgi:anti-sigma B factor antagonist
MTALSDVPDAADDAPPSPEPPFVAALAGEIDMERTSELHQLVAGFEASAASSAVIDLSAVTFMDSTGLGTLSRLRNVALGRGGGVTLVGASAQVTKLLAIVGFDGAFTLQG